MSINRQWVSSTVNPVPGFTDLLDQERPVRLIKASLQSGNIPNAFLFTGLCGTGKKTAALAFAMACNCRVLDKTQTGSENAYYLSRKNKQEEEIPCGYCGPCKKISAGTHPDIHIVNPTGTVIKVEQIRSLCRKLALRPNEAFVRLALICNAHRLNPEAGNTLLKTLEEPPDKTVFILTAIQASDLLPTIVSRCRHIRFNPISSHHLSSFLKKEYEMAPAEADVIADMADGSFVSAKAMAESGWIKKRNWIIEQIQLLSGKSIRFALAFSETLSKNKNWLSDAFFIMKTWYRDIAVFQFAPESIINKDLNEKIKYESTQSTTETTLAKMQAVELAEQDILASANIRSTLDALMIMLFGEK